MADRIVLHIGTMKTGTSFVQNVMVRNADAYERAGYLYVAKDFSAQARATRKVLAAPNHPERHGEWQALAQEARAFAGETAIISMEFLSFARPHQIAAYLAPFEGMEVRVIVSLRDQARVIPAQWQSYARLLGTDAWPTYLRRIDPQRQRGDDAQSHAARTFWRAQSVVPMIERWGDHPGVSRLDVVTVPAPPAPDHVLWERFCAAVGMPADLADLSAYHGNTSLGYASCEVVRRLNPLLAGVPGHIYRPGLRPIVRDSLKPRKGIDGKPVLDAGAADFALRSNAAIREAVAGLPLYGDLADLPVAGNLADAPRRAPAPDRGLVHDAAVAMWERCAAEPGVDAGSRPRRLSRILADIARMLPESEAWQEAVRTRGWTRS